MRNSDPDYATIDEVIRECGQLDNTFEGESKGTLQELKNYMLRLFEVSRLCNSCKIHLKSTSMCVGFIS